MRSIFAFLLTVHRYFN